MRASAHGILAVVCALTLGGARVWADESACGQGLLACAASATEAATSGPPATEASPPPPPPADSIPRHVLFKGEGGEVRLVNRIQFRWTDDMPDENLRLPGTAAPGDSKGYFRIRRAKTELTGWVWNPRFTYELQLSWAGPEPGASTQTPLEDAILSYDVSGHGAFQIRFGQFKVPLGRQEMTSSGRMQFADRDELSFEFTRGRDLGVQLDGVLAQGKVEYFAGIFNGNAASHLGNDNGKYQYNARVTFQPFGPVGYYSESDFESRDKPLAGFGLDLEHNDQRGTTDTLNEYLTVIVGFDGVFKYKGFSLWAEYFLRSRKPEVGADFNSNGFHAQAGYFLVRDRWEVAGRYASWDPTDQAGDDAHTEVGGALNYYIKKHALKIQGDFRQLEEKDRGTKSKELRIQAQVMF